MSSAPTPFDVTGELPEGGTWVLEASAGTGKTYTIAALAVRYLAAGIPLSELMMVTFTRAATQELRERIRAKLAQAEAGLREALAGAYRPDDAVIDLLCRGNASELQERLRRIGRALADFDAATIATTHEFCGRMLDGLGVLDDPDPQVRQVEEVPELVREVAADLWLRKYATSAPAADGPPTMSWPEADEIARRAAEFDGPLAPDSAENRTRLGFVTALRSQLFERKRDRGLRTFEDLLTRLRDILCNPADPKLADEVAQRLSARFTHVLIDEFQDTDPVQWQVVEAAFIGRSTVVLIGDPKQAIYSFRGADVYAYLEAVGQPGVHVHTLERNYRSDPGLLAALDAVLGGAELGDPRIAVRPVLAHHPHNRLANLDAEHDAPFRLRVHPLPPPGESIPQVRRTLRPRITEDLVSDISALLQSGATIEIDGESRSLRASDVAVLVKSNALAESIRGALQAAGIPVVHAGATSVYGTREAKDWLTLLRALEQPRPGTIRLVALSSFVGWTLAELTEASETALNDLSARVRGWARVLARHGVAALMETMNAPTDDHPGLAARLLSEPGGERRLTDIRHIAQSLHAARSRDQLGVTALIEWLTERCQEAGGGDERTRRLDTDRDAVQVMTVHRSKGLEFPIVYLPDQWDRWLREAHEDTRPFTFHADGTRTLFLPGAAAERPDAYAEHRLEQAGEDLRLLYVALTRAQCQVVAWYAFNGSNTPRGALTRMLFRAGAPAPAQQYASRTHPRELPQLQLPQLAVQELTAVHNPFPARVPDDPDTLQVRRFERTTDEEWRRTSYSGLTAAAHQAQHGADDAVPAPVSDDELAASSDEVEVAADDAVAPQVPAVDGLAAASPMAELPRGTDFGTLVHTVYEHFDPAAADLRAELSRVAAETLLRLPSGELTAAQLAEAMLPAVLTPLGPVADGLRLADIPAKDRLPELDFEYPLAGGDRPTARVLLGQVADLLRRHLAADDPLADYPEHLGDPELAEQVLRGFLIGSIDAVLRIPEKPSTAGNPAYRYLVVDYKTNWLGSLAPGAPLLLSHYTRAAMAEAMMAAHYPLQALLYAVALHRYLRWRQPGYDPGQHLGGVAYLFVRGMAGEGTPMVDGTPTGVFSWYPPAALVAELSDLLDGTWAETEGAA
ncbi:exodeoxyribonuclease V beta subunit [Propionibacteriaceae bacterium ES.041]|uniref:UvrD-helicase domain-containing protein n=1 Tax=Enemella evansiae TaxID=2016499 RepID=UPI000B963C2F|nr:UvrD-helicase domain-containing protein [Enemella evansiae]OYN98893.1 exodeoxyribonuclease V subunit beta [Enemella evansiae]PFG67604.1 exodeoxyribonuclease V beta subunit [Propionibacteriaceae bacterium ES.041]